MRGPRPVTAAVNHVLHSTPLAMERLRAYAGRTAAFDVGPVSLAFTVQTTGEVTAAQPEAAPDVRIRLSPFLLPRLALQEEAAFREIEVTGDAEFAHEISFLARNLRWDAEEDLAAVTGDVVAHRVAQTARTGARWLSEAAKRTAHGAAEYWTEESPLIASRVKTEDFIRAVSELRAALERLEKRIDRLEVPR